MLVAGLGIVLVGSGGAGGAAVAGGMVDHPRVGVASGECRAAREHVADSFFLDVGVADFVVVLQPPGASVRFGTVAVSAQHLADVGTVVAQIDNASAADGRRIVVAAEEEYLASCLADGQVGTEIDQVVRDGRQALLQHVGKSCAAVVALRLVAYDDDAELRGIGIDEVAELLHDGVEVEAGGGYAVVNVQLVSADAGPQVEGTHAEGQHLLHALALRLGKALVDGAQDSREGAGAGVVGTGHGELADEGLVLEEGHPAAVVRHLSLHAERRGGKKEKGKKLFHST